MERKLVPHYKRSQSNGLYWLAVGVSIAASLGYLSQKEEPMAVPTPTDVAPVTETHTPEPTLTQSVTETPVPTLNGIPLPVQIYPPVTPTSEVPDIFSTITANNR